MIDSSLKMMLARWPNGLKQSPESKWWKDLISIDSMFLLSDFQVKSNYGYLKRSKQPIYIFLALGKQEQGDLCELEASLTYILNSTIPRAM